MSYKIDFSKRFCRILTEMASLIMIKHIPNDCVNIVLNYIMVSEYTVYTNYTNRLKNNFEKILYSEMPSYSDSIYGQYDDSSELGNFNGLCHYIHNNFTWHPEWDDFVVYTGIYYRGHLIEYDEDEGDYSESELSSDSSDSEDVVLERFCLEQRLKLQQLRNESESSSDSE